MPSQNKSEHNSQASIFVNLVQTHQPRATPCSRVHLLKFNMGVNSLLPESFWKDFIAQLVLKDIICSVELFRNKWDEDGWKTQEVEMESDIWQSLVINEFVDWTFLFWQCRTCSDFSLKLPHHHHDMKIYDVRSSSYTFFYFLLQFIGVTCQVRSSVGT